jgi:hypothetical protein
LKGGWRGAWRGQYKWKICRVDYSIPEKRPLFDHFSYMSECLLSYIPAALRLL